MDEIMQIFVFDNLLSGAKIRIYFDITNQFFNPKSLQKYAEHV